MGINRCRRCGKEIVVGISVKGRRIILDPITPVYFIQGSRADGEVDVILEKRAMPCHIAFCKNSDKFRHNILGIPTEFEKAKGEASGK